MFRPPIMAIGCSVALTLMACDGSIHQLYSGYQDGPTICEEGDCGDGAGGGQSRGGANHSEEGIRSNPPVIRQPCDDEASDPANCEPTVDQFILGIGRPNMVWTREDRVNRFADRGFADIALMHNHGIRVVRTDLRGFDGGASDRRELDRLADLLQEMQRRGIKALVLISLSRFDFDDPQHAIAQDDGSGAFLRKCGRSGGQLRIGWVNVERYRYRLEEHLKKFAELGIDNIVGFEVLNEPDWVCFNGDIWIEGRDVFNPVTITKYGEILRATHTLVKSYVPRAKIISGGLANIGLQMPTNTGFIHSRNFLTWVNATKDAEGKGAIDRYVDAVGVHFYPTRMTAVNEEMSAVLTEINAAAAGKPLWITEFGFSRNVVPDENARTAHYRQLMSHVRGTLSGVPVTAMFPFALSETGEGYEMVDYVDGSITGSVPTSCQEPFFSGVQKSCGDVPLPSLSIFSM